MKKTTLTLAIPGSLEKENSFSVKNLQAPAKKIMNWLTGFASGLLGFGRGTSTDRRGQLS